jgi:hypothetical protein
MRTRKYGNAKVQPAKAVVTNGSSAVKATAIAREIGDSVYQDCRRRNFSPREAQIWKRVFQEAFSA